MNTQPSITIRSLVFVPALITLAVTAVRLALELGGAPRWLANSGPGGTGALIGIVWLPLVFGPWFAFKLREAGVTVGLWKRLAKTLLVYGLLARVPVFLLTIPAVLGSWGTHYDGLPPTLGVAAKLGIAFGAQIVFWACVWTVVTGTLAGLAASALRRPRAQSAA